MNGHKECNFFCFILLLILSFITINTAKAQCNQCLIELNQEITIKNDFRKIGTKFIGNLNYSFGEDFFLNNSTDPNSFDLRSASAVVIGGYDNEILHLAANNYASNTNRDYIPGPEGIIPEFAQSFGAFFKYIWTIKSEEIVALRNSFQNGELVESEIPYDILNWPAKGNPFLGMFSPSK